MFVFTNLGNLPWNYDSYSEVYKIKIGTTNEELCDSLPSEFCTYLNYCEELAIEDKPDYKYHTLNKSLAYFIILCDNNRYLRQLFHDLFQERGFENDGETIYLISYRLIFIV